ncbi:HAD hydrolase-like protein [Psychrobacillus vulpis]|uniref:HAD family hydrolase n=1 Tax=Psychrobacillus vulpis TaxID=2325572 RepID=A0A544TWB0_9BACI|nr:HAD hydrolase-like protein [Psychrobacillus vulpis]TQR21701.1 HAD family hydrolase [Psychrobacillus vulpis]
MKKSIIFDMDGTLFQTNLILEPSLEATFEVLRKENLWSKQTPLEEYQNIMGVPLPVVWETLLPGHNEKVRNKANTIFHEQLIHNIQNGVGDLYDGVQTTLSTLEAEYDLYIASNGQMEYLQAIVEKYNLNRWIQQTYSIQQISSGNKSDLVQLIKENHQITKGFVVGDRLSDINAAKDNDLIAIGCNFDFAQAHELQHADAIISNFSDLIELDVTSILSKLDV